MPKLEERISSLETRLKQLKAKQAQSDARKRTIAARRVHKDEVRRKILVGAIVLERIEVDELAREQLRGWLETGLKRKEDRDLFPELERGDGHGNSEE